jgi:hypothetical protein
MILGARGVLGAVSGGIEMSRVAFSQQIAIEVLRRAMTPGDKTYGVYEYSFAVLEHVRRLGMAGLIIVGEPMGKVTINVSSITPGGEAMLAWLSEPDVHGQVSQESATVSQNHGGS